MFEQTSHDACHVKSHLFTQVLDTIEHAEQPLALQACLESLKLLELIVRQPVLWHRGGTEVDEHASTSRTKSFDLFN